MSSVDAAPPAGTVRTPEDLQRLIDQVAGCQLIAAPAPGAASFALRGPDGTVVGFQGSELFHRFATRIEIPSAGGEPRSAQAVGEAAGRLDFCWLIVPHDFLALPDRAPPPTPLDPARSQRFAMQEATFSFGDGRDGFRSFGTGRTFPFRTGGSPKLVLAAVGNVTAGFGRFRGHEGNFALCGDLTPDHGFRGHVILRVVDPAGDLRSPADLPALREEFDPDPESSYLVWGAQKGKGPGQGNSFSVAPDGQVRGLNIPTQLKHLDLDFATDGGFRCRGFQIGTVLGQEVGFGRGSDPDADPSGSAAKPFSFEGVAHYSLFDAAGAVAGALTTNVLEGRRFDVRLPAAPEQQVWRFGFFGPIVRGSGCFSGVEGMFYGVSGSILQPPPGDHIITHFYAARLHDSQGRFRAVRACR